MGLGVVGGGGRGKGGARPGGASQCRAPGVLDAGDVPLEVVGDAAGSLALRRRVKADARNVGIDAARAGGDLAITLGNSQRVTLQTEPFWLWRVQGTESLRFRHLAQASTRRRTLVRASMAMAWS